MRKGLRNILLAGTMLAGAGAIDFMADGPISYFAEKIRFKTFAEAYKEKRISQYKSQLSPKNTILAEDSKIASGKFDLIKLLLRIKDTKAYFRSKGILCFEKTGGSSYVAPIEREGTSPSGRKVYFVRTGKKGFPYVRSFRGHRRNTDPSTIFKDEDGRYALLVDLAPNERNHNGLEDVWDKEIEANHKLYENKDLETENKKWDHAIEIIYLTSKDVQRDQVEEKATEEGLEGLVAHEDQHAEDKEAGLFEKLPRKDIEKRGYLRGLMYDASELYGMYRDAANNSTDESIKERRDLSKEIIKGIYQIRGVKTPKQYIDILSK